jgi:ribosomal protein L2
MPVVKLKPTSPGRRAMVKVVNPTLYKGRPVSALTESKKRGSGRNNLGPSISVATRTAFRRPSSGWSTIRIAARTWPCCVTQTASGATSWRLAASLRAPN